MDVSPDTTLKQIERVVLACVQCRSRHVKCDATLSICKRCERDGKVCDYRKSRRGELDKAALAQCRLRLQQEAERAQHNEQHDQVQSDQDCSFGTGRQQSITPSQTNEQILPRSPTDYPDTNPFHFGEIKPPDMNPIFQVSADRLLEPYFDSFWPSFPFVLLLHHLLERRLSTNHGTKELWIVLQYVVSIYAP
jgi:hypothetical protein